MQQFALAGALQRLQAAVHDPSSFTNSPLCKGGGDHELSGISCIPHPSLFPLPKHLSTEQPCCLGLSPLAALLSFQSQAFRNYMSQGLQNVRDL